MLRSGKLGTLLGALAGVTVVIATVPVATQNVALADQGARSKQQRQPPKSVITREISNAQVKSNFATSQFDCNWNGVPDSTELMNGTADDMNSNGICDDCQSDSSGLLADNAQFARIRRMASLLDPPYFRVRFRPTHVEVRYTVPDGGAHVTLCVLDERATVLQTIYAGDDSAGAFERVWDRSIDNGIVVPSGTYSFRLTLDNKAYERDLRWAIKR